MNKPNKTIIIARAIIRIGDAARNANDYSLLGALREMVEQLSQHGVKDTDVDMDLLLEYVEAADGCDYCRAGDGKPSVDELTTKSIIAAIKLQSICTLPFFNPIRTPRKVNITEAVPPEYLAI